MESDKLWIRSLTHFPSNFIYQDHLLTIATARGVWASGGLTDHPGKHGRRLYTRQHAGHTWLLHIINQFPYDQETSKCIKLIEGLIEGHVRLFSWP